MATFKPLIADSLCVAYGKADVLISVHVEINPGEITCLLGSNGAGKTTFIRALTGLTKPHAGTIQFDGLEITGLPPHRIVSMGISCIPEGRRVFPAMNVEENLLMGAYQERDRNRIRERLARVYDLFPRLKERRTQAAGTMSGGDAVNITAGEARMVAVLRSFSDAGRDTAIQEVRRICKGIGIAFDCDIEVNLEEGYALQYNDPAMIDLVNKAVTAAGGKAEFIDKPFSGSEDFSFFGKLTGTPSAFMMVDAGRGENAVSLHNGKIVFNEEVIKHGVTGLAAIAVEYLNQ